MEEKLEDFQIMQIHKFVNIACGIPCEKQTFPGAFPVSLSRKLLREMTKGEFAVSFKADGLRVMLGFIRIRGKQIAFTMDRKGTIIQRSGLCNLGERLFDGTLFETEMVDDLLLLFDCSLLQNIDIRAKSYPWRLELVRHEINNWQVEGIVSVDEVVDRPPAAYQSNYKDSIVRINQHRIKVKTIFYAPLIAQLPSTWIYPNDGFIWTDCTAPFATYRSISSIYKWKPFQEITFDFLLTSNAPTSWSLPNMSTLNRCDVEKYRLRRTSGIYMMTHHQGNAFCFSSLSPFYNQNLNGIFECRWSGDEWCVVKSRPDKDRSNDWLTIVRTLQNIEENISRQELMDAW